MVGDQNDAPARRYVFQLGIIMLAIELEMAQRLLDKVHTAQVRKVAGKAPEL